MFLVLQRLFFLFVFFSVFHCFAQNILNETSIEQLKKHVSILASDSFVGRNTGQEGQKKAAFYLQNYFRNLGLDSISNGYLQPFELTKKERSGTLNLNGKELSFPKDFGFLGHYKAYKSEIKDVPFVSLDELEKVSYSSIAIEVNSLKDLNVSKLQKLPFQHIFIFLKNYNHIVFNRFSAKYLALLSHSSEAKLFFINNKFNKFQTKSFFCNLNINQANQQIFSSENVLAYLPGSDSLLKKEYIVVSAHYDHLGQKGNKIYNGADDNASGTASLLELARILKSGTIKIKRSVLFICFTGEEHGLLGSAYYTDHPVLPLSNCLANFNIDMIGHRNHHLEKSAYQVYAIGSDKIDLNFHKQNDSIAQVYNLIKLNYVYNRDNHPLRLYYRSDHYNFAKKGIPSVFYFGGFHKRYHRPTDEIQYLDFNKIALISDLIFNQLIYFGNR